MSFKNIPNILFEYRTLVDEVINNFYVPCLEEAVVYKRAVGFFSSSILLQISKGLGVFAKNGGKIKLLVSPRLEVSDYEAIKKGYELREIVEKRMLSDFDESITFDQKIERFTLLSYLIANNILDIKVAVVENEKNENAMYHEKLGIMIDDDDNIITFSGSSNETAQGFSVNYECIDVFCSWKSDDSEIRCNSKDMRFDKMWDDNEKNLKIISFPQVIKDKLLKYNKYENVDFVKIDKDLVKISETKAVKMKNPNLEKVKLFNYQIEAIENWALDNYKGIFDMATGTGKTYTGLGAITRIKEDKKRVVVVICCPYIHLVEQWSEEVKVFNIEPIKCYGSVDYKQQLKRQQMKFKTSRSDFVCIITTNGTFQTDYMQEMIDINLSNTLLVVDEAHNFGSTKISQLLNKEYPYRLALSATIERFGDKKGTQLIYDFFGNKCIEYTLEKAIIEQKLTPYKYYPILVTLTENEFDSYQVLTEQIRKFFIKEDAELPEALKRLLIQRARIVAGAENKIEKLKEIISKYKDQNNLLVYCGAVKYNSESIDDDDSVGKKQIQIITEMLNKDLNIVSTKFTAEEDSEQRKTIINAYKNEEIQALVAIKCLDEGMNVPAIKTAFILASSTNPKEYIQRRGRVLRKYPGKEYAEIYDFITLPRPLDDVFATPESVKNVDIGLVQREISRLIEFARISINSSYSNEIIDEIKNTYNLSIIKETEIE